MKSIELMDAQTARSLRWVLTDIDDTMTRHGRLSAAAYSTLCRLKDAGFRVIAVTGRSAGWGEVHLQEWPVDAVIAENGAVTCFRQGNSTGLLVDPSAVSNTAEPLRRAFAAALSAFPRAKPARDNNLRVYDYAIDHAEYVVPPLEVSEVEAIIAIFEKEGCKAKPSSIHINTWIGSFDKRRAALAYLTGHEGYRDEQDRERVLYIGDALNDEVMFEYFPNACAVANIDLWLDRMTHTPTWVSQARFGDGFAEIGERVLSLRSG